ncbi:MAG: hypothetical protein QXU67_04825, partial [Candidatus Bathyarchaeia archaeon]
SRRGGLNLSQLEDCIRGYLEFNPQVLEKRQHYALLQVLNFVREDLEAPSIEGLLKMDMRTWILLKFKYVHFTNKSAKRCHVMST